MGARNFLVEGLSGTGKTSVADELRRRGHDVVHGDRELAYQGDPSTGEPVDEASHDHHVWDVEKVRRLVSDRRADLTFFCGGSRNSARFIDLFDGVFVLEVDLATLMRRLDERAEADWGQGGPTARALIEHLHVTGEGVPREGIPIDAARPLELVVDRILEHVADAPLP